MKLQKILILSVLLFLTSPSASALEETDFQSQYDTLVRPFLASLEEGTLITQDEWRLSFHVSQRGRDRPSVVIVPGYSESWLMYGELIYDLDRLGYNVFIMDHRGMGFSGRLTPHPNVAHVEKFSVYVDDEERFINEIVLPRTQGSRYLLGHSMGGLVSVYLVQRLPSIFRAMLLSAPLFQLNTGFIPEFLAYGVVSLQTFLGYGALFAPGRGGFDPLKVEPQSCTTTHSVARCTRQLRDYVNIPQTFISGPSGQWVKSVMEASADPAILGKNIGQIPTLLLQAEQDYFVRSQGQEIFCRNASSCQREVVPHSFHEIFQEKDAARERALAALKNLFRP